MASFRKKRYLWIKLTHHLFVAAWFGGALILLAILLFPIQKTNMGISTFYLTLKIVDNYLIVPGVFGCLITGVLFSLFTNWGFFKYPWILIKYIVNLEDIILGSICVGPWIDKLILMADYNGIQSHVNEGFIYYKHALLSFLIPQLLLMVFVFYISVFKPWSKRKNMDKV